MPTKTFEKELTIRISYDGFDPELDKHVQKLLEEIGAVQYAQGFNHLTKERDVCFKLES